jgi:hypothetical protein
MTDLDIRVGINGIRIDNKEQIIADIKATLDELKDILDIPCNCKEHYSLYKDVRKRIKDERNMIWNEVKTKVASFTSDITSDQKALYGMYDELYNNIDQAIKAYETENEVGAARAKITREANKAEREKTQSSLILSLQCPSEEVKARIVQYATDLGAVIL